MIILIISFMLIIVILILEEIKEERKETLKNLLGGNKMNEAIQDMNSKVVDDSPEWEYKLLKGKVSEVQMKLNQWRHQFIIRIKYVSTLSLDDTFLMVITRKRR